MVRKIICVIKVEVYAYTAVVWCMYLCYCFSFPFQNLFQLTYLKLTGPAVLLALVATADAKANLQGT